MVRLTRAVVLQGISKVSIDKRDTLEIDKEFGRITHLHLQKKSITTLDSLHLFQSLTVLYLYENQISKIEGLEQAHNLEILHLQRNRIQRMENLLECKKLRKLYIGYNEIEAVEGLHTLVKLEELHVEHQRLQNGMSLSFDPKTLSTLCNSLLILNISGNNITHFEDLAGMDEMHTLQASENLVTDLDSTSIVIRTLANLRVLDLRNNPIAKKPQFKERIIGFAGNIAILNEKEVSDTTRDFIQRFATVKANRLQHAVNAYKKSVTEFSSPSGSSLTSSYPQNSPYVSQSAIFGDRAYSPHSISMHDNSIHHMTPTRSNLSLNLPPGPNRFHTFRRGMDTLDPTTSSKNSLTHINAYLSNTDMSHPYRSASSSLPLPQFILAPPPPQQQQQQQEHHLHLQHQLHEPHDSLPEMKGRRGSLKMNGNGSRRNSVSVPSFKKKMSSISEESDEKDNFNSAQDLFKAQAPKTEKNIWSSSVRRPVVNLIKPPTPIKCSRQSFVEGMPMPSKAMLHLAQSPPPSSSGDLTGGGMEYYNNPISPKLRFKHKTESHALKPEQEDSSGAQTTNPKMLHDKFMDPPPFTTSVYELPPWPHIIKRWTTEQPAVTFMP